MALDKSDNPSNTTPKAASASESKAAVKAVIDAGAGAPKSWDKAVDDLPEKDEVQKAYKDQLSAKDHKAEVAAKVAIVNASPDADDTPSGAALLAVAGESDPIKQGDEYQRRKAAARMGTAEDAK